MKHSIRRPLLTAALAAAVLTNALAARADPPAPPAPTAHEATPPRSLYRLEVTLTGVDPAAHPAPATYSLVLLENEMGTLSTGTNIALNAGPGTPPGFVSPRQDVGLSLHVMYTLRGAAVLVTSNVELSAADQQASTGPAAIHRVRIDGTVPVTPGHPAVLGSVFDLVSHRRYEVTVAAQRVL